MKCVYKIATLKELELIWDMNIRKNVDDKRWIAWRRQYIQYNINKMAHTFCVIIDDIPVGEGTLILSPECVAIQNRTALANNLTTANINALRISKDFEGCGHISKLVHTIELYAKSIGLRELTIGVEAKETRNLSIYLHWGYNKFIMSEVENNELILYYKKLL